MPTKNSNKLDKTQLEALASLLPRFKGVRKRSDFVFLGLPLYCVAFGPDFANGQFRGHARGVLAFGDTATGIFAFGGLAMGVFAFGGLALGLFTFGGLSIGLFIALGGAAIGTLAFGGGALGVVAVGGAAAGYYAAGGAAYGTYVLDALRQNPEAVEFFSEWSVLEWLGLVPKLHR